MDRWCLLLVVAAAGVLSTPAVATPYVPADDAQILAQVPTGAHHSEIAARRVARGRRDVAIPLAQFYIGQARSSGDLRFLGYAEAVLAPWVTPPTPVPAALVLQATVEQSRHEFAAALATLERSLAVRSADPQAWLTRATVLRVMGRYPEAAAACGTFADQTDRALGNLCSQSVRGLRGQLAPAYLELGNQPVQGLLDPERAWRASELGEMAVRLGRDREAERWFQEDLGFSPHDSYARAVYADLLLRQQRPREVLALLRDEDSIEPLLLRIAIAQKQLHDQGLARSSAQLEAAFNDETRRGAAVHRREQARFLLEVEDRPQEALSAALLNWQVQHEPDDVLVLVRAARAAGRPERAAPALDFIRAQGLQDARLPADLQAGT